MVQIFFEEGVIGLDARNIETACGAHSRVVGNERRVDVHEVETLGRKIRKRAHHAAPAHAAIFGIAGHARRGDAHDIGFRLGRGRPVVGRDQYGLVRRRLPDPDETCAPTSTRH